VLGSDEHCFIKCFEILEWLGNWQLLKMAHVHGVGYLVTCSWRDRERRTFSKATERNVVELFNL
jgi:hypothetical protein